MTGEGRILVVLRAEFDLAQKETFDQRLEGSRK